MNWKQRLKLLVVDDNQRGRIKSKLIFLDAESRATLFDDNNDAVRASLLGLIEPAAAARQVPPEQDDRFEKTMGELRMQLAEILKAVASKRTIRISDASSTVWRNVQSSAGVKIEHIDDLFDATKHKERIVPQFDWGESTESGQADEYVNYIKREMVKSKRKWSVINGNKHPTLLDNDFGGTMFEGTVDVAVVIKSAHRIPETGLKIIFELKKAGKINKKAEYQTMVSLLLANVLCGHYRPVAMLSDLGDQWIIFWMDDFTVLRHEFTTRSKAVGFLDAILEGDVEPKDHSSDIAALRRTGESSSRGVKRSFSGRQKFWTPEMERLEELAGFLPEDELRQGRAAIALRYAMNTPAFYSVVSDMRESSKPFFEGMYSTHQQVHVHSSQSTETEFIPQISNCHHMLKNDPNHKLQSALER